MSQRRSRRALLPSYLSVGYAVYISLWWWRPPADCPVTRMLTLERCPDGRLVSVLYGVAAMGVSALICMGTYALLRRMSARRSAKDVGSPR